MIIKEHEHKWQLIVKCYGDCVCICDCGLMLEIEDGKISYFKLVRPYQEGDIAWRKISGILDRKAPSEV